MLQKLSLNDLTCVSGGQIYAFFDKEKEIYHYLVPSVRGFAIYYNATEAKHNSKHLPRNNIVNCRTLEEASFFARSDCAYYQVLDCLK